MTDTKQLRRPRRRSLARRFLVVGIRHGHPLRVVRCRQCGQPLAILFRSRFGVLLITNRGGAHWPLPAGSALFPLACPKCGHRPLPVDDMSRSGGSHTITT